MTQDFDLLDLLNESFRDSKKANSLLSAAGWSQLPADSAPVQWNQLWYKANHDERLRLLSSLRQVVESHMAKIERDRQMKIVDAADRAQRSRPPASRPQAAAPLGPLRAADSARAVMRPADSGRAVNPRPADSGHAVTPRPAGSSSPAFSARPAPNSAPRLLSPAPSRLSPSAVTPASPKPSAVTPTLAPPAAVADAGAALQLVPAAPPPVPGIQSRRQREQQPAAPPIIFQQPPPLDEAAPTQPSGRALRPGPLSIDGGASMGSLPSGELTVPMERVPSDPGELPDASVVRSVGNTQATLAPGFGARTVRRLMGGRRR